jgi:hypothetical protein
MTALPISSLSPAQTAAPPKPGAIANSQAGTAEKSFAELLQGSLFAKAVPEKTGKEAPAKTTGSKDEKEKTPSHGHELLTIASLGVTPVPQASELDIRGWSLAVPKKEGAPAEAGNLAQPLRGAQNERPAVSTQQIAFGATVTNEDLRAKAVAEPNVNTTAEPGTLAGTLAKAELKSKVELEANAATANKPQQTTGSPVTAAAGGQGKEQHSGSFGSGHDSSPSRDSHPQKTVPAAANSSSANTSSAGQQQFHVPAATTSNASVPTPETGSVDTRPAAKTIAAAPVSPSTEIKEPDATTAGRTPTIHLQAGDVNVRVSQRAGDVQITVRTADNDMAQSLRQHLPELADKLTQSGVHADLWEPAGAQVATSNNGTDSQSNHNSDAQTDSQGRQQSGTPEDRQNRQQRQQDWQQEFSAAGTTDR